MRETRRGGRPFVLLAGVVGLLVALIPFYAAAKTPGVAHAGVRRDADAQVGAAIAPPAWLAATDGGVFSLGSAPCRGSVGGVYHFGTAAPLPDAAGAGVLAVGLVPTRSGGGYWIAVADGTVRAFGNASPLALPPIRLAAPVVGIATPWASSSGYALPLLESLRARQRTWVGPHEVALTFDDGPGDFTLAVLAVLARYHVPATFFTVGELAAAHPDLIAAEANAGMSVEVHDWSHADLTRLSIPAIRDQLIRAADAIEAVIGHRPTCFRPPYGSTNSTVVAEAARLGLTQVLWNVDPSDYLKPGAGVIASRVLAEANGRGLVVGIHDGGGDRSQTVAALPAIIEGLHARGYTFVRLCA